MKDTKSLSARLGLLLERINHLSVRERAMVFGAGVVLLGMGWQALLMEPLAHRARTAQQQLLELHQRLQAAELAASSAAHSPAIMAAARNRALEQRLAQLDTDLAAAAHGYVAPERVAELLGELISRQQGLTLISLRNLPVESLARRATPDAAVPTTPEVRDRGPFLHPLELIISGDYPSIVRYLQALEQLPWRLHWERLELQVERYPANRVRLVIGALSLSRDWMSV